MNHFLSLLTLAVLPVSAQSAQSGPTSHHPVVEVKGTVKQVHIEKGAGMPWLEVETANGPVKLMLGSMRYLMQNDFSPKAGDSIHAKAFQEENQHVAISIDLPGAGKSLKLRDNEGRPVWRGGMAKDGGHEKKGGHRSGKQTAKEAPKA